MSSPRSHRWAVLALAFVSSGTAFLVRAGDIVGTINNASNTGMLPGAVVTIVENGRTATSDSSGQFRFSQVPAGNYTLSVSYVGYEPKTERVTVPATGAVPVTVRLGDQTVVLDAFVVEGYREGRSRALQQKQSQIN